MTGSSDRRASAGYSGKPLLQKLGFSANQRILVMGAPPHYAELLGALPDGTRLARSGRGPFDAAHVFTLARSELERQLPGVLERIATGGFLWISWPKRASGVPTDVTEDVLREVVLPMGWVDVKVCAVDETWSGLRFYRRRKP